jgi:hypothetical protein
MWQGFPGEQHADGSTVYLDETGNPSLELRDELFPVFVVVLWVCDESEYVQSIVPAVYRLKMKYFGHEGVILHSRDIRKAQGDFGILTNPQTRQEFMGDLSRTMGDLNYRWIACAIKKERHKQRYGSAAEDPYDLALAFALERLLPLLEGENQTQVSLFAEARGKREDKELEASFLKVVNYGTRYIVSDRFRRIQFSLRFIPKGRNVVGNQLADLVAYPIARHVLDPTKSNLAYDVISKKEYRGHGLIRGLKVFP